MVSVPIYFSINKVATTTRHGQAGGLVAYKDEIY